MSAVRQIVQYCLVGRAKYRLNEGVCCYDRDDRVTT